MLRLSTGHPLQTATIAATAQSATVSIARQFTKPLLELARLLREAANIEHALMIQYLFAAFSVKERYRDLVGTTAASTANLLGVAIQEMQHLSAVNELLVAIGAQPNLDREDFPFRSDIYPFALELEPLTRSSVAKYVTAEAPADALDPGLATTPEEKEFRQAVMAEVGQTKVNHIGSLYGTIIRLLGEAATSDPTLLTNVADWTTRLEGIRGQGEHDHFLFFRTVFEGSHPALGDVSVWADPASEAYPSIAVPRNPTAMPGDPRAISDDLSRQLAWLSDLHYWTVLGLLYAGHAVADSRFIGFAISHMGGCLDKLGRGLAARGVGMPFDALALNFGAGPDRKSSRIWLTAIVDEIQLQEAALGANLPQDYSRGAAIRTLRGLGEADDLLA